MNSLLPLALLVAGGAALLRLGFYEDDFRQGLDRLVYWVLLPALIVAAMAEAPREGVAGSGRMIVALTGATVGMAALGVGIALLGRLRRARAGVFVQACFRGNLAFVGLPVITLAAGEDAATLAKAVLVLAPLTLLFNVMGVGVLVAAQRLGGSGVGLLGVAKGLLLTMAGNPLLLACAVGLGLWQTGLNLPAPAVLTLDLLGACAAPLALLSLGGAMVVHPVRHELGLGLFAAALKCVGTPLLAWGLCVWLGLSGTERQVVLIFAASPTAVASYVLAVQLRGNGALAAAAIVLSTVLSAASLGAVLIWGG